MPNNCFIVLHGTGTNEIHYILYCVRSHCFQVFFQNETGRLLNTILLHLIIRWNNTLAITDFHDNNLNTLLAPKHILVFYKTTNGHNQEFTV